MLSPLLSLLLMQAPAAQTLTLDDAIRQAMTSRGRPGSAAAQVAGARAERRLAGKIPNPTASYEHTGDTPHQHLLVDQPLDWLTTRGANRGRAAAGIRRAEADSALAIAELVQDVRVAFFGALAASQSLRLVQEQAGLNDSLARIARARLAAGDISQLEYDQAAQEARRGQQLLSVAREAALAAGTALARAIGSTAETAPVASGELDLGLGVQQRLSFEADSIPAVKAAIADSAAAVLALTSARRGRLPVPSLVGGTEWDDPTDPGRGLSVIGFSIPLPFWNVGGAEVAVARANAARAAAEAREARLEATRGISEALIHLEESAGRAQFARDSLVPAAQALRLRAVAAYRAGETGVLPVLDALRGEREIALAGVQDLLAFQVALARWRALLGRPQ